MVNKFVIENPSMLNSCLPLVRLHVTMHSFQGIPLGNSICPESQRQSILYQIRDTLNALPLPPYQVIEHEGYLAAEWQVPFPYQPKKFLKEEMKRLHKNLAMFLDKIGLEIGCITFDGKFAMYEYDQEFNFLYDFATDEEYIREYETTTPIEEFYAALGFEIVVNKK